jgi:glutamate N-acetyltransferase / amino-acid N-acetyltransferase
VGYSGISFDPSDVDIYLQELLVCRRGVAADFDEAELKRKLAQAEVHIRVVLNGRGKSQARFFTCDLTEEYVKINASYRS